ncbi:MAG: iron-binding protein [Chitinivibrionales bacterium]|nr:iron-binding protein [Chitinivibrionales bacterium]MBD3396120.1 iron-binding protein [Chitinivibrionales bacterium]
MEDSPRILIQKNGPYKVEGSVPLASEVAETDLYLPTGWKKEQTFPTRSSYLLCRCGKSSRMPFCDGAHSKSGFDGTETASNESFVSQAQRYSGPGLDLDDAKALCSGARFCDRKGGTWHLVEKSDDAEARGIALQQACDCPSGRLVAIDKESGAPIEPELQKSISVTQDAGARASGPLWVKGGIPVVSEKGTEYEVRNRVTLCRCGNSRNKPFCDGSHIATKFNDGALEQ